MIHVAQNLVSIENDLVATFAFNMRNEANSTAVPFLIRAVQAVRPRVCFFYWSGHLAPVVNG
jgi:hypothetical protein